MEDAGLGAMERDGGLARSEGEVDDGKKEGEIVEREEWKDWTGDEARDSGFENVASPRMLVSGDGDGE